MLVTMNFSRDARRISRAEGTPSRAVRRTLPRLRRILPQFIASAINCNFPQKSRGGNNPASAERCFRFICGTGF